MPEKSGLFCDYGLYAGASQWRTVALQARAEVDAYRAVLLKIKRIKSLEKARVLAAKALREVPPK